MARAFHAASQSPATVPASPLPSKNTSSGGLANLQWLLRKRANKVQHGQQEQHNDNDDRDDECASMFSGATPFVTPGAGSTGLLGPDAPPSPCRSKHGGEALSRLRSAILAVLARARRGRGAGGRRAIGSSVTGTIFGRRRGRVHLALQTDPRASPSLMVELAAYSTGALVREMASGLVRLALECEKAPPPPQQTTGNPSIDAYHFISSCLPCMRMSHDTPVSMILHGVPPSRPYTRRPAGLHFR